jgi:hypothetical protein
MREAFAELDALDPVVIASAIETAIMPLLDPDICAAALAKEERNRAVLERVADRWSEVEEFMA